MTPDKYIELANRTAPARYPHFTSALIHADIVHAWLGVTTECGESGDVVKKALIYGKEPDLINLDEEFGDKLWYIALYCKRRKITFEDLMEMNIAKLAKRFPDKFTEDDAINRDVIEERKTLEFAAQAMSMTRTFIKQYGRRPVENDGFLDEVGQIFTWTVKDGVGQWEKQNAPLPE